jgi:plasmid maintenance system killer protein
MNVSFEDVELEKLITTHQSKRYKKYTRDKKFLWALDRVFNDLQGVAKCSDLKQLSYLHYEQLKKNRFEFDKGDEWQGRTAFI